MPEGGSPEGVNIFHEHVDLSREKYKEKEVVRTAVSRSKSVKNIRDQVVRDQSFDLNKVKFSSQLWIRKNQQSFNPDQLMPAGGGLKEGETPEQAASRELGEETHLLPVGGFVDLGQVKYKLPEKKAIITARVFGTKILPADTAFSLHPEEDKIADFHYLDLNDLSELFLSDKIQESAGGAGKMWGALKQEPTEELIDVEQQESLRIEIARYAEICEAEKKIDVMRCLGKILNNDGKFSDLVGKINYLLNKVDKNNIDFVQHAWEQVVYWLKDGIIGNEKADVYVKRMAEQEAVEKILFALDLSNFSEEIKLPANEGGYNSRNEAVLRFACGLLETKNYSEVYLEAAKENPFLNDIVSRLERFIKLIAGAGDTLNFQLQKFAEKIRLASDPKTSSSAIPNKSDIELLFCSTFSVQMRQLNQRLLDVDEVLYWLETHALDPKKTGGVYHKESIKQINEVTSADVTQLLEIAFPAGHTPERNQSRWRKRLPSSRHKRLIAKRLVFEARRKLALLFLFADAGECYREEKLRQVGNPIETGVYSELTTLPGYDCNLERVMNEKGELLDVKAELFDGSGSISGDIDSESTTVLRELKMANGSYFIASERPTAFKSKESYLAQMIIGGFDDPTNIKDVARRALLIIAPDEALAKSDWLKREEIELPANVHRRNEEKKAIEYRPVVEVLISIAAIPGVSRIFDYTPTPNIGEKVSSRSAGGDVRFAKFYIEYKDQDGETFKEEVQVYIPDEQGRSAFYHKARKEEDDARYFLQRLFKTKGRSSFVDLLYPPNIYGAPIRSTRKKGRPTVSDATGDLFEKK